MKRKGFTLIELLVVISIIALLMSIMVPALSKIKGQAKKIVCMSRLRQWAMPIQMYTSENNGKFNKVKHSGMGNQCENPYGTFSGIYKDFWTKNPEMLLCPNATKTIQEGPSDLGNVAQIYSQVKQKLNTKIDYKFSYTYSYFCHFPPKRNGPPYYELYWRSTEQRSAEKIPMWGCGRSPGAFPYRQDEPPMYSGQPPINSGNRNGGGAHMRKYCVDRHNKAVNLLFMDFTVRSVRLKKLWYLKWHREYDVPNSASDLRIRWPDWLKQL